MLSLNRLVTVFDSSPHFPSKNSNQHSSASAAATAGGSINSGGARVMSMSDQLQQQQQQQVIGYERDRCSFLVNSCSRNSNQIELIQLVPHQKQQVIMTTTINNHHPLYQSTATTTSGKQQQQEQQQSFNNNKRHSNRKEINHHSEESHHHVDENDDDIRVMTPSEGTDAPPQPTITVSQPRSISSNKQQQQQQNDSSLQQQQQQPLQSTVVTVRSFKRSQSITLCQMDPSLHCVSASINTSSAHIVAMTTLRYTIVNATSNPVSSGLYETFLIQLSDYTNHFDQKQPILFKRSNHFQRIQFVSENSFLFFCVNEPRNNIGGGNSGSNSSGGGSDHSNVSTASFRIELYKFQLNKKTGQMMTAPTLYMLICDSCMWFQWDPDMSYLYYMASNKRKDDGSTASSSSLSSSSSSSSSHNNATLYVSCWALTESVKVDPVYRYNVPIKESDCYHNHDKYRKKRASADFSNHVSHQRMLMKGCCPGMDFTIVSLDNNVDCLCKQEIHDVAPNRRYIMIQIFILTHQQTIKFAIPIGRHDSQKFAFFGRQKNVLIAYVPGIFLKMITINRNEQPANLVTLSAASNDSSQSISNLSSVCKRSMESEAQLIPIFSRFKADSYVLNTTNGEIYSYLINSPALLHLLKANYMKNNNIERLLPMLNWSIMHESPLRKHIDNSLQLDFSFPEMIIYSLYQYNKEYSRQRLQSTYLFKEFILATSFMIASDIYKMEVEFLTCIPNSIIAAHPYHKVGSAPPINLLAEVGRSPTWNQDERSLPASANQTPISDMLLKNPYETEDSLSPSSAPAIVKTLWQKLSNKPEQEHVSEPQSTIPRSPSEMAFDKFIKTKQEHIESDYIALCWRFAFYQSLRGCISNAKIGKAWAAKKWAAGYTFIVAGQVSRLFQIIQSLSIRAIQSLDVSNENYGQATLEECKWYFHLLELFYRTLEELSVPVAPHFHFEFSLIAFHVLPRRTFMQYVRNKVIFITQAFVDYIHSTELCRDASFYNTLLHYMVRNRERNATSTRSARLQSELAYLESDTRCVHTLVSYYHSLAFQDKIATSLAVLEKENKSSRTTKSLESHLIEKIFDDEDTASWDPYNYIYGNSDVDSETDATQDYSDPAFSPMASFMNNMHGQHVGSYSGSSSYMSFSRSRPNSPPSTRSFNGQYSPNSTPPSSTLMPPSSLHRRSNSFSNSNQNMSQPQHHSLQLTDSRRFFIHEHSIGILREHIPWL